MFSDDDGVTAWKPNRVTKSFLRAVDAAGLRRFRLHDLRHFMATEMLQAGVALDYYAHAVPSGDEHAALTLRTVINGRP